MDSERLLDAIDHCLVVSEITKTATPDMPYVTIMGPTVDDVATVVEAARKWADHEEKNGACLRGITAVEDPNFEMEAPDEQ